MKISTTFPSIIAYADAMLIFAWFFLLFGIVDDGYWIPDFWFVFETIQKGKETELVELTEDVVLINLHVKS